MASAFILNDMMNKTQILVICRHAEILQTIIRLVNNNPEWECTGANTDQQAIDAFNGNAFDLVLLGSGIEPSSEENLVAFFRNSRPRISIVQHYGGGSGLLSAEIYQGLSQKTL